MIHHAALASRRCELNLKVIYIQADKLILESVAECLCHIGFCEFCAGSADGIGIHIADALVYRVQFFQPRDFSLDIIFRAFSFDRAANSSRSDFSPASLSGTLACSNSKAFNFKSVMMVSNSWAGNSSTMEISAQVLATKAS